VFMAMCEMILADLLMIVSVPIPIMKMVFLSSVLVCLQLHRRAENSYISFHTIQKKMMLVRQ